MTKNNMSKWEAFKNEKYYKLKNLGRPAIFLLPVKKLRKKVGGISVDKFLNEFILKNFGAYTTSLLPIFGFWRNDRKKIVYDKCLEYEVSFIGKEKIPLLLCKLAEVATAIDEE